MALLCQKERLRTAILQPGNLDPMSETVQYPSRNYVPIGETQTACVHLQSSKPQHVNKLKNQIIEALTRQIAL